MATLETLRHDHRALRHTAERLEETLAAAPSPAVACRLCVALVRLLEQHLQREQQVLAPYACHLQRVVDQHCCGDHADPHVILRDLQEVLSLEAYGFPATAMVHLRRLLGELREDLANEERELFPLVESAQAGAPAWPDGLKKLW